MSDAEPVFRILVFSTDGEAESQLRRALTERVAQAEFPADVITEKGVITAPVDLILGLSDSDVDRASRFLPEGATVAFTVDEFARALSISPADTIDRGLLVTDVRPFPTGAPPTVDQLRDAVARARRLTPATERSADRLPLDDALDVIVQRLAS